MYVYLLLAALGLILVVFRKQMIFCLSIFYIFYVSLVWDSIVRMPVTPNTVHSWWTKHISWFFGCKFTKLPGSKEINKEERTIILINHVSMADFFIHDVITEHTCNFLSRMLIAIVFPLAYVCAYPINSVWYFVRGGRGNDLEKFFQWVDGNFNNPRTERQNLLVYPEGHRNFGNEKHLALKKGMIRYIFERGLKAQIIISFGNEKLLNERNFTVSFEGTNIVSHIGEIIDPKKFQSSEQFYEEICARFDESYKLTLAHYKNISDTTKKNKD